MQAKCDATLVPHIRALHVRGPSLSGPVFSVLSRSTTTFADSSSTQSLSRLVAAEKTRRADDSKKQQTWRATRNSGCRRYHATAQAQTPLVPFVVNYLCVSVAYNSPCIVELMRLLLYNKSTTNQQLNEQMEFEPNGEYAKGVSASSARWSSH